MDPMPEGYDNWKQTPERETFTIEDEEALLRIMKPCAFCGHKLYFDTDKSAMCDGCGMSMPGDDLQDIVAKVNTRFIPMKMREGYHMAWPGL